MMEKDNRYDSLIQYYSELNNLDWLKIKAQIRAESAFDPNARSPVGAVGLAQFMPNTWREWLDGKPGIPDSPPIWDELYLLDPRDPEDAIHAMCALMRWLMRQFEQDDRKALAAYNWGIGNLKKLLLRLMYENGYDAHWIGHLPKETASYLVRINRYYVEYLHEQRQT